MITVRINEKVTSLDLLLLTHLSLQKTMRFSLVEVAALVDLRKSLERLEAAGLITVEEVE